MSAPNGAPGERPLLSPVPQYRPPWWHKVLPLRPPKDRHIKPRSRMQRAAVALVASAASLVIVVGCLAALYAFAIGQQGDQPLMAARQFCAAEVNQDYATAFGWLAPDVVSQGAGQFIAYSVQRDQRYGVVRRCDVLGRNYLAELDPNGAAVNVLVMFADGASVSGVLGLHLYRPGNAQVVIAEGNVFWRVFSVDAQLHLVNS